MARYIDANQIRYCWMCDADGKEHDGVTLQSVIDKVPTADVVPKSEVDHALRKGYELGKRQVAKEILEEIHKEITEVLKSNYNAIREHNTKHFPNTNDLLLERIYGKIDTLRGIDGFIEDLKNKYTEGKNE